VEIAPHGGRVMTKEGLFFRIGQWLGFWSPPWPAGPCMFAVFRILVGHFLAWWWHFQRQSRYCGKVLQPI